jgi:hypothetical protein
MMFVGVLAGIGIVFIVVGSNRAYGNNNFMQVLALGPSVLTGPASELQL